jgi:7-alpha-hydroxysteroid dehydrogenase
MAWASPRLAGRVAIVTGASRGLGAAVAEAFAREGAAVAVAARTEHAVDGYPGSLNEVVGRIVKAGGRAMAVRCDVSQEDDLVGLVEQVRARWGPVTLLVNNAAITVSGRPGRGARPIPTNPERERPASALAMPAKGLRRQLELNVLSAYRLIQLVAADMIVAGGGTIINVGSDAAHRPGPGPYADPSEALLLAYGTSKAALQTMTQYLACDFFPHRITVNVLLPSAPIDTPGLRATAGVLLETAPIEGFAEAAVRLALATTDIFTGRIAFHDDVLHPERSPQGWIGS